MKISKIFFSIITLAIFGIALFYSYKFYKNFLEIEFHLINLEQKLNECHGDKRVASSNSCSKCLDFKPSGSRSWLDLHKTLKNTVVQVLVTSAEYNVLQPYQVPSSSQSRGSGFIISEDGEIVTNAHVASQATSIMVQMPIFGKHQFEVDLIGIMPEKDFALLKFKDEDKEKIEKEIGRMPFLDFGDSDKVVRAEEILALGYPLGQESLKSTTGVISGHESGMIQMSAPINPGSSGGPSLNSEGKVIGINSSGVVSAQNVGYIIPINDMKIFMKDLRAGGLVRKPYIGVYQSMATEDLVSALGNPKPGGTYVVDVLPDSPLKGQLMSGDMIYEVNGIPVDLYGEMSVPWSEDKVSTAEYISRLAVGQKVTIVAYRKGERKNFVCNFDRKELPPIRVMYPGYEELPYEIFGGYVVMPLMLNHLPFLIKAAPGLAKFAEDKEQAKPRLVISYVLPNSAAYRLRLRIQGSILKKVNGDEVYTLDDLRKALKKSKDQITVETTDNILVALDKNKVLSQERNLAQIFGYKVTEGIDQLLDSQDGKVEKSSF